MDNRLNLIVNFAEKGLSKLGGGLKNLVGLGKDGSRAMRDMGRETRKLEDDFAGVRKELAGASGNVTELVNRERDLERAVRDANEQMRVQRRLNAVDARADAMRSRGSELIGKGQSNIAGGAAMLAPVLLIAKAGADFSSTMVDIQQKANLSDKAMLGVRNNILEAARAGKQLPADIAAGVDTLAGLGMETVDAAKVAPKMSRFMTAFKVEGTDAAASIYAGLSTMNIPLAQTGKLLDMMAQGGNVGAFEVKDMAAAFPSLTAQMKALGQTGTEGTAELVAMLETVRKGTGTSEQAATQASDLLSKLTAPTTVAAFKKNFAIDVPAAIKKGAQAGISPLETMIALTKKATGGDLTRLGYAFSDKEAGGAMRTLILEYEAFAAAKKEVAAAEGVTDKGFDLRVANDQTVPLRELAGAMSEMALSVAPVLLPFLKQVTAELTRGANAIASWAKEHPEAAGLLLKLVAGVASAKIALGGLQIAFGGMLGPMATAYRYFGKIDDVSRFGMHLQKLKDIGSKAGPVLSRGFTMIRTAGMLMVRGLARAGMMLLANPIFLMGALLAGIAVLVYLNWGKISGFFQSGVQRLKDFFSGLPAWFTSIGKNMMAGLLTFLTPGALTNRLIGIAKTGVTAFKNFFGIKSPSRLFMGFGGHMATGLALGIDRKRTEALSSARRLATGVAGAAALGAGATISPAAASGSTRASSPEPPVTFNIYQQPGEDAEALVDRIERKLEERKRRRRGSELGDD